MSIFVYVCVGLVVVDVLRTCYLLSRQEPPKSLKFMFSRYDMYRAEPGSYEFGEGAEEEVSRFNISKDGYLDEIRQADVLLLGGSSAFGVGALSNETNLSAFLREVHGFDIINLSIPGWNVEQAAITFFKHWERIRPKKCILFDGANNLALGLPYDYNNLSIDTDPYAFYREREYRINYVNGTHCDRAGWLARRLARKIFKHSFIARAFYRLAGQQATPFYESQVQLDTARIADLMVANYIKWVTMLASVCTQAGCELIVATQPYYLYGVQVEGLAPGELDHLGKLNPSVDSYMLSAYDKLDAALTQLVADGVTVRYLPQFKSADKLGVGCFADGVHLTSEGYEIVAEQLAVQLNENE